MNGSIVFSKVLVSCSLLYLLVIKVRYYVLSAILARTKNVYFDERNTMHGHRNTQKSSEQLKLLTTCSYNLHLESSPTYITLFLLIINVHHYRRWFVVLN